MRSLATSIGTKLRRLYGASQHAHLRAQLNAHDWWRFAGGFAGETLLACATLAYFVAIVRAPGATVLDFIALGILAGVTHYGARVRAEAETTGTIAQSAIRIGTPASSHVVGGGSSSPSDLRSAVFG